MSQKVKIDFSTFNSNENEFIVYLVEEGPWNKESYFERLKTIQNRIYSVIDAIIDGQYCEAFPESKGGKIKVQVDCYDPPTDEV